MKRCLLLGMLAIGCGGPPASDLGYPNELPEASPPLEATPVADPPPPVATPSPPAEPEPVPDQLGTPASSLAAVPRWARGDDKRYAPQTRGVDALFDRARPSGDDASAMACRLSVGSYREWAASEDASLADLSVRVSFSGPKGQKRPLLIAEGADDDNTFTFLLPLAPLKRGDDVSIEIFNRNVVLVANDFLGQVQLVHRGELPLEARRRSTSVECRAIPRTAIEAHFLHLAPLVDKAIGAVEAQRPDLFSPNLGLGDLEDGGVGEARETMDAVAGLVGWDDPRVVGRVKRLDDAEARIAATLAFQADALRSNRVGQDPAATDGSDDTLQVRAAQVSCGPEVVKKYAPYAQEVVDGNIRDTSCVLRMDLTNVSDTSITISTFFGSIGPFLELKVLSKSGGRFRLLPFGQLVKEKPRALDRDHPLAPGQTITLLSTLAAGNGNAPADGPMLLRLPRFDAGTYSYVPIAAPGK